MVVDFIRIPRYVLSPVTNLGIFIRYLTYIMIVQYPPLHTTKSLLVVVWWGNKHKNILNRINIMAKIIRRKRFWLETLTPYNLRHYITLRQKFRLIRFLHFLPMKSTMEEFGNGNLPYEYFKLDKIPTNYQGKLFPKMLLLLRLRKLFCFYY